MIKINKMIMLLLVGVLILGSTLPAYAANDNIEKKNMEESQEIVELRGINSKVFKLNDGTYKYVGYAENIHYLNKDGVMQKIENDIINDNIKKTETNYKFKNKDNVYTVRFGDFSLNSYPVFIDYKGKSLSFSFKDGINTNVKKVTDDLDKTILSNVVDKDNSVIYNDVYKDVDIVYISTSNGVKENIILKKPVQKNEYYFDIELKGLSVKESDEGKIVFIDENDKIIFEVGELFAIDSKEIITEDVTCDLIEKDGKNQLKISLNKDYITDPDRAWPIIIDPSIMVTGASCTFDSFVGSKSPNTNYNRGSNMYYLRTGRDAPYYTRRTYIKFNLPTNIPSSNVTSAYLRFKKYSGSTPSIKAYRVRNNWSSNTITWNNKPSYSTSYSSSTCTYDSNNWYKMGVTTLVKKWLAGTYSNYGFMVKDATESGTTHWTTFYSSDASSPNKPELIINYNGNNYNEGYDSQLSSAIGTVKLKLYVEDIYPIYMNCSYNASIDIDYYYQKVNNLNKVWLGISDINTYIIDTRYLNYGYCFLGAGFDNHIVKESSTVRNSDYQEHYVSASHASDPDDKYANYRYKFYNSFPYGNTALYWGNYSGSDCSDLTINSIINVYGDQRFGSNKDTINLSLKKNK